MPPRDRPAVTPRRSLALRIATLVVGLPPALWVLHLGGYAASALLGVVAALGTAEYYRMVVGRAFPAAPLGIAVAFVLPLLAPAYGLGAAAIAFWLLAALVAGGWGVELIFRDLPSAPIRVGHLVGGAIFGSLGMFSLALLRSGPDGASWAILLVAVSFGNDACAYAAGNLMGKRKLAPRVSPGKTWEGVAAGAAASFVMVAVARATFFPTLSTPDQLVIAAIAAAVGPIGDLSKSLLKRACGAKDSGRLLPGHGGILDRVDALSWNCACALLYVAVLRPT